VLAPSIGRVVVPEFHWSPALSDGTGIGVVRETGKSVRQVAEDLAINPGTLALTYRGPWSGVPSAQSATKDCCSKHQSNPQPSDCGSLSEGACARGSKASLPSGGIGGLLALRVAGSGGMG